MKICFVADLRSPTSVNWIKQFIEMGHEVHAISTYPFHDDVLPGAKLYESPVALGQFAPKYGPHVSDEAANTQRGYVSRHARRILRDSFRKMRYIVGPIEIQVHRRRYRNLFEAISPDLIHALRIPFEGMIAAIAAPLSIPVVVSTWGSDLALEAPKNPMMSHRTRQTLHRVDGLHSDTLRDVRLAVDWEFDDHKPSITLPGAGGVRGDVFHLGAPCSTLRQSIGVSPGSTTVLNPRGFRPGAVRQDVFFKALTLIRQELENVTILCLGMEGEEDALRLVRAHGLEGMVSLLPKVPHHEMGDYFRSADISVSLSVHDGTPNSLLEAMACGCFPVVGDIESTREWIDDGQNGLLVDATDAPTVATALQRAIADNALRDKARSYNQKLIHERASRESVMKAAEAFYRDVLERKSFV